MSAPVAPPSSDLHAPEAQPPTGSHPPAPNAAQGAFAPQADDLQRAATEELQAAWQLHVDRVEQQLNAGWRENIGAVVAARFSELEARLGSIYEERLEAEVARIQRGERRIGSRRSSEYLNEAVRAIQRAETHGDWVAAVTNGARSFAQRVALLSIRPQAQDASSPEVPNIARGTVDLEGDSGGAVPSEPIPLRSAPAFLNAIESGEPVVAVRTGAEISVALENMLGPGGPRSYIFPVKAASEPIAVLYAEGEVDGNALESIASVAGMAAALRLGIGSRKQTSRSSGDTSPRPSSWNDLPADDQEKHLRAQRFARTMAAEMRLYRAQQVREGRANANLYGVLQEEIDRVRADFRAQFLNSCGSMVDYVHVEILRTLANNDASLLGAAYPGPLV